MLLRRAFSWVKRQALSFRINNFDTTDKNEWAPLWSPFPRVGEQIEQRFRQRFNWADGMSGIFAERYRSSFIISYFLGASAVLAAFLGSHPTDLPSWLVLFEDYHIWFVIELALISGILLLVALGIWGRWHKRWIDYRRLAEGLRQMRALTPFARVTPTFEVPAHLSEDSHGPTWFNWYFRACVRESGLVQAEINKQYLQICCHVLKKEIRGQIRYHHSNEKKLEALHLSLHLLSGTLFFLTLIACLLHILKKPYAEYLLGDKAEGILTLIAVVFPAFGAAIQGILHQGEFGRIAHRSRSIKKRLEDLLRQVRKNEKKMTFSYLGRMTESFSETQVSEQADWHSLFTSKEAPMP